MSVVTRPMPADVAPRARRSRLVPPFADAAFWGWFGPIAVTLLAGYLRFNRLSIPGGISFDEKYYAPDAQSLWRYGVETTPGKIPLQPEYIVHPPLGKWMIGIGEQIFGYNSLGWRFSAAVVGTLSVLIVARTARRMTRSTLLGCIAGLVMCFDGIEFVQSRTGMLDIFLMFWTTVAFACLVLDRDHVRERLARSTESLDGVGPKIGVRWWLIACGVAIGAAGASKWNGVYLLPTFALLAFVWTMGARRAVGVTNPVRAIVRRDAIPTLLSTVVLAPLVYLVSWTGWFLASPKIAYDRGWADHRSSSYSFVPAVFRSWVHYHAQIWQSDKILDSYHAYRSDGWGWLFLNRPVWFAGIFPKKGQLGCTATSGGCVRMVYSMGNPAIWWVSIPVMVFMLYLVLKRDWRGGALLLPFLAMYLPWLITFNRTMFEFYALPLLPFLAIALAVTMGYVIGPADATPTRRMVGTAVCGIYLMAIVVLFFYFLPLWSAQTIPYSEFTSRMWFTSWLEWKGS
jgi:dolichyl-phosphate-mannose-protein mannosyltransferase